jgi:hypothetical protein
MQQRANLTPVGKVKSRSFAGGTRMPNTDTPPLQHLPRRAPGEPPVVGNQGQLTLFMSVPGTPTGALGAARPAALVRCVGCRRPYGA